MKGSIWPRPYVTVPDPKHPGKTIRKPLRGSTWTYQFAVAVGGKRRNVSKGGYRTRKLAEEALAAALSARQRGTHVEPSKLTLGEYLQREWLPLVETSRKPTTVRGYRLAIENRIVPLLGDVRLRDLSAGAIANFYGELRANGRLNGRRGGLSEQSVRQTHAILHVALEHAVEAGLIARNPARMLPRAARPRPRRTEMKTWSADELRVFLASVAGDRLAACFTLAAMSGLRRGELLGLRWEDLDLARGVVAVRRSRVVVAYAVAEGEPKSGRARTVDLNPETVAVLRRHRAAQLEERLAWGGAWEDTGYVFTAEDGNPLHPQALSRAFVRRAKRAGLPVVRLHDLRHTYASLLLADGVHPKVVQEMLGHANIATTMDVYSHVAPGMQSEAAARLGALVFGSNA